MDLNKFYVIAKFNAKTAQIEYLNEEILWTSYLTRALDFDTIESAEAFFKAQPFDEFELEGNDYIIVTEINFKPTTVLVQKGRMN